MCQRCAFGALYRLFASKYNFVHTIDDVIKWIDEFDGSSFVGDDNRRDYMLKVMEDMEGKTETFLTDKNLLLRTYGACRSGMDYADKLLADPH